jgi:hypothetical protein
MSPCIDGGNHHFVIQIPPRYRTNFSELESFTPRMNLDASLLAHPVQVLYRCDRMMQSDLHPHVQYCNAIEWRDD